MNVRSVIQPVNVMSDAGANLAGIALLDKVEHPKDRRATLEAGAPTGGPQTAETRDEQPA